jgi:membrane protease YdiL (CAAX protease family)
MSIAVLDAARPRSDAVTLTIVLTAAVAVRVSVAGAAGAASLAAGAVFALILAVVVSASRPVAALSARALCIGLAGAVVVVLPAVVVLRVTDVRPASAYAGWAVVTTLVAVSEEAVLRGALFTAISRWRGADVAVAGGAVAFALLHVPLYGWRVLPVDLAVGMVLGALRLLSGGWAAPAVAHAGADLAGWWLV